MKLRLAAPVLALGLLAFSACGGGDSTGGTVPAGVDVEVHALDGIAWNQKSFTATPTNGNVTIYAVNDSGIAHNMYVIDANDKVVGTNVDLPHRGSNGTVVLPLAPGTYHIVCKVPGHNNMNSTLTVN